MSFWFLSKGLGHGLRVGVGVATVSKRLSERERFLLLVRSDVRRLLITYWLHNGVVGDPDNLQGEHLPDPAGVLAATSQFVAIDRMIRDGGTLTSKRKDQMLAVKYHLQKSISKMDENKSVFDVFNRYTKAISVVRNAVLFSALFFAASVFLPLIWGFFAISAMMTAFFLWRAYAVRKSLEARAVYIAKGF